MTEEPLIVVGQPGHPLAANPATLAQIAGEPFIDFPLGWGNRAVVDRAFAAAGLDREVPFEAADFTAVINLVRGGLGIAFLPATVAADLGADLDVIEICDHTFTLGHFRRDPGRPQDLRRGPRHPGRTARTFGRPAHRRGR